MNKKIEIVVEGTCEKCPYCYVDIEVGESFCSNKDIKGDCCITFDGVFHGILENCSLPDAGEKPMVKIGNGNSNISIKIGGR